MSRFANSPNSLSGGALRSLAPQATLLVVEDARLRKVPPESENEAKPSGLGLLANGLMNRAG